MECQTVTRTLRVEWNPRARLNKAAGFQFTNLSHLPQGGHLLLLRSDQSSLRADARRHIPDYFAYGADEGYSALGPVSEPAPAQGNRFRVRFGHSQ